MMTLNSASAEGCAVEWGGNSDNRPGGGRVYRQHSPTSTGKRLAAQHAIADANAQLALSANVLF
ncbi:Uncharacterised protein [Salmonella enterica subsp. enterica]|uniref:Uncharacterized protein n=1 Tax=Salmonella enterica I TaxID=59201 RepID=A0A447U3P4_SALET|nr:Uncharacterised protein [Salmonella enterica subsp. enterica]